MRTPIRRALAGIVVVPFPDGRVHDSHLPMRLTSGVYRVRASYDKVTTGGALPFDQVIDVSESGTVVLRLDGDSARCP